MPRKIEDVFDAWKVYKSGFGSFTEWSECSDLFYKHELFFEADECAVKAINALGKLPGKEEVKWRTAVSVFVRGRLGSVARNEQSRRNLRNIADSLQTAKKSIEALREHRIRQQSPVAALEDADVALAESILLAGDSSQRSRVQLAATFRNYNRGAKKFRWEQPLIAIGLMNDHLGRYPDDSAAKIVRASAQGDLGNWDEAWAEIYNVLKDEPENEIALSTGGRILIGMGSGYDAWDLILQAYQLKPSLPLVALLLMSTAKALTYEELDESQIEVMTDRRELAANLMADATAQSGRSGDNNLVRIGLRLMIFNKAFVEAIKFAEEMQADGLENNFAYWHKAIDDAILRSGQNVAEVRMKAAQVKVDLYPDRDKTDRR